MEQQVQELNVTLADERRERARFEVQVRELKTKAEERRDQLLQVQQADTLEYNSRPEADREDRLVLEGRLKEISSALEVEQQNQRKLEEQLRQLNIAHKAEQKERMSLEKKLQKLNDISGTDQHTAGTISSGQDQQGDIQVAQHQARELQRCIEEIVSLKLQLQRLEGQSGKDHYKVRGVNSIILSQMFNTLPYSGLVDTFIKILP